MQKVMLILTLMLIMNRVASAQNRNTSLDTAQQVSGADVAFVNSAVESGMAEVMLGNLTQTRGSSESVLAYGAMMVSDHQKANEELKALAGSKGYKVPATIPGHFQEDYERLRTMTGVDFDKAFMKKMIDDHEKVVKLFREEAENGKDPDLRNWAAKTLPVLEHHLQHAKEYR